jgi:hypothetical protein
MSGVRGSLMKIGFVLEVARKDSRFLNDLARDPFRTLEESGIDLSRGEIVALIDIVKDTSISTLAPALGSVREQWKAVLRESSQTYSKEPGSTPTTRKGRKR